MLFLGVSGLIISCGVSTGQVASVTPAGCIQIEVDRLTVRCAGVLARKWALHEDGLD